ncbi:MAG: hypothetical protein CMH26_05860 [Micavibrio sp.]|nr:hypothetical protein [Micavibrio sp.]
MSDYNPHFNQQVLVAGETDKNKIYEITRAVAQQRHPKGDLTHDFDVFTTQWMANQPAANEPVYYDLHLDRAS